MASLGVESDSGRQFSGGDELIGVISSWDLSRTGETGYALVVTRGRVIGARRAEADVEFIVYLGPGSTATASDRERAVAAAARLLETRQFVLAKDDIAQILFRRPGLFSGGYAVFKTRLQAYKVEIAVVSGWNGGPLLASRTLMESLRTFSPDRLYDGKTGAIYIEELLRRDQAGSDGLMGDSLLLLDRNNPTK
ncbi:MAG: hypothetical protein OK474_00610 [Thaumarchaeota archaeon]|nr:hypothetical protein [Nitrososphaerota archaeon]